MADMAPRHGPRDHVKLVDLGTHHDQRYVYAHNNNPDNQVDTKIGHIGRGPLADRLWAMLCAAARDHHQHGRDWQVIRSLVWAGKYDREGAP